MLILQEHLFGKILENILEKVSLVLRTHVAQEMKINHNLNPVLNPNPLKYAKTSKIKKKIMTKIRLS